VAPVVPEVLEAQVPPALLVAPEGPEAPAVQPLACLVWALVWALVWGLVSALASALVSVLASVVVWAKVWALAWARVRALAKCSCITSTPAYS